MTKRKLQKVLYHIAYNEKMTTWTWLNFNYHLHQNDDHLAVTRTRDGGRAQKLLSHEETIRALKAYRGWKTHQYAQTILGILYETCPLLKGVEHDYYINQHSVGKGVYYSVDKVHQKSQDITNMRDIDVVNNSEFSSYIGQY